MYILYYHIIMTAHRDQVDKRLGLAFLLADLIISLNFAVNVGQEPRLARGRSAASGLEERKPLWSPSVCRTAITDYWSFGSSNLEP